ncbi:NADP oxidoreductase [Rhodococcus sp. 06-462-5]|uniref:NADPH-dependent F420 reductase n=1 Tax=unclassified Rhodococcus (in: high G+C Gram-positive bacteria) TaxID=192944 RepID=UPI000B9C572F|nr:MULTISPECIES: NAD(P)-binding domain-containing protein [unclassified Rhodococcus (in: high G+C Gram-positive bacteria)]OZC73600.1 NADP oxidoreductase [Rhodococcus sp. 06-462-5]OZE63409.1 NADP oxidoreductase [Rhodococcus sp. 02-925g]
MSIGIIGSGGLGSNLARALANKGISATISNSRGPESLATLVGELGASISAGTVAEAAAADIVVVAVRWESLPGALEGLPDWNGRIVVDGTNPVEFLDPEAPKDPANPLADYGIRAIDLGARHSSEVFSEWVTGARVIKAFNHLDVSVLGEPAVGGGKRVLFYSGNDADAKAAVGALIEQAGFSGIDLGALDVGGPLTQLPFGALATHNFVKI